MCEVLPCSSGHWALNTLWKTFFFFLFSAVFSVCNHYQKPKNTELCNNFQCSAALHKVQLWTPVGKKANRKAVFSLEMWGCWGKGFMFGGVGCPRAPWQHSWVPPDPGLHCSWNSWAGFLWPLGHTTAWAGSFLCWPGMDASGEMLFWEAETWE